MPYLLGVDTGGTYTDAVVLDEDAHAVVAKAKAPTTHDDLAIGIGQAIDRALESANLRAAEIDLVSLSTTLATNALVEDKGRRACLILLGFDEDALARAGLRAALGDDELVIAAGGHTSHGDEVAPLDLDHLSSAIERVAPTVDAFAVTAQFSVRNPSHEERVRDLILERTGHPVTCSHELSADLNGPKRGVTALLNARLIAMIDELVEAARTMLDQRGVTAPVMIVRGNGSLVAADFVRDRPIETILSGPAASLIGAGFLTDVTDAIVADIGGTTTDIAVLRDGRPQLGPEGASVGGHQTMVEAVLMHTHGLGGDSQVALRERAVGPQLVLGPRRVTPIGRAAQLHPELVSTTLRRQLAAEVPGELDGVIVMPAPSRAKRGRTLTDAEARILDRVAGSGVAADRAVRSRIDHRALDRLVSRGAVRVAGFTPTDAAHVLGHQADFDAGASTDAATLFARRRDRYGRAVAAGAEEISRVVTDTLVRRSAEALLSAALGGDAIDVDTSRDALVAAALDRSTHTARVDIGIAVPLVGLGAPAPTYYPAVAALLGSHGEIPAHADVANAIGAVTGRVRIAHTITVTAPRRGVFRVHLGGEPATTYDLDEARAMATEQARRSARADADAAGAREIETEVLWTERTATIEGKPYFVEGAATVVASGRPRLR